MKFTINLQRPVEVRAWRFQGEVGILQPQPWVVAVAKMAAELDGSVSTEDVSRQLLGGRFPIALGLIQQCLTLNLLEEYHADGIAKYRLTEFGRRAAERGEVFVPQPGTWTLWVTEDDMLDERLLLLEPWREPSALDEVGRNRHIGLNRDFVSAPRWLRELEGREIQLPMGEHRLVRILSILDQIEDANSGNLSVHFHLNSSAANTHVRLIGSLPQPKRKGKDQAPEPKVFDSSARKIATTFEECWQALLECEGLSEKWDAQLGALQVSFPAIDNERRTLLGEQHFNYPGIPGLGFFNATQVRDIPLSPATETDAHKWAHWLLREKITTYASERQFKQWSEEACAPFIKWQPTLPARKELAARYRPKDGNTPSQIFWNLQAPHDWNL